MSAPTATAVFAHQPRALPRPALARKGWIKVIPRTPRGILVQPFGPLPSERVRRG